jgi:2-polyprenyl-3-methyl-5-hydroxy-6-metoxy-1,4-benzoquinol methylase
MSVLTCANRLYENSGNQPLIAMASGIKPGYVLDCGCGAGDNARILQALGWTVMGITISAQEQKQAAAYCSEVHLLDLNCGIPDTFERKYDLVLLSHVLEHLVHPDVLLRSVLNVLNSSGQIAVALPNVLVYSQRFRFLIGQFDYALTGLMDETHVHFYTFSTGADLLRKNGYEVCIAQADGAFPLWKIRNLIPKGWVIKLNRWASHWRPGLFGTQLLYMAKAASEHD